MVGYNDIPDVDEKPAEVAQKRAISGPWWVIAIMKVR